MKDDILGYIIIFFILILSYKIYRESDYFNLKCIISDVNGEKYCVRERKNMKKASDLIAKTAEKMKTLVSILEKKI